MSKLLRSDFRRMMHSKILYLCLFAVLVFAAIGVLSRYYYSTVLTEPGYDNPNGLFFLDMMGFSVLVAILDGFFVGTEYQDKTIRNKLIIGHSKIKVYLSYFAVTSATLLLLHTLYAFSVIGLSAALLDNFKALPNYYFTFLFYSFATVIAQNAFTLMLCMVVQNKAYGLVLCIVLALVLVVTGESIQGRLDNPKTIGGYEYEYDGEIVKVPEKDNPYYVGGTKRAVLQFLNKFSPGGQAVYLSQKSTLPPRPWSMPTYSATFALLTTVVGVIGFKRRDLK